MIISVQTNCSSRAQEKNQLNKFPIQYIPNLINSNQFNLKNGNGDTINKLWLGEGQLWSWPLWKSPGKSMTSLGSWFPYCDVGPGYSGMKSGCNLTAEHLRKQTFWQGANNRSSGSCFRKNFLKDTKISEQSRQAVTRWHTCSHNLALQGSIGHINKDSILEGKGCGLWSQEPSAYKTQLSHFLASLMAQW